ncbi:hypothetical protein FC26_GL000994 [Paucilactobacillus vaccinostercus DSM 20634]|uniref:Uncharacterized protein n=1 Tax=Paucilactobacillus vaccinostercus DSM 20634 TaxID=1423813 RepID=A0A0R2AFV9_9LACO|nr:hypothetical protein FC26_GL000994 [Paucilactobacillus vaccinostercus DSM 20634]
MKYPLSESSIINFLTVSIKFICNYFFFHFSHSYIIGHLIKYDKINVTIIFIK